MMCYPRNLNGTTRKHDPMQPPGVAAAEPIALSGRADGALGTGVFAAAVTVAAPTVTAALQHSQQHSQKHSQQHSQQHSS